MSRKPIGDRPLTLAERAVRHRVKQIDKHRADLERVLEARTKREADDIALAALRRLDDRMYVRQTAMKEQPMPTESLPVCR